jgi:signal transduction histidine kinase
LSDIERSAQGLLELIDGMLLLARAEARKLDVVVGEVSVPEVVNSVAATGRWMLRKKPLALEVEIEPDLPSIASDRGKLVQILLNLLANAIKFTARGEVGIRAAVEGEWVTFGVWDTGIGIAKEHLSVIFSPFWQVEQRATRQYGGTGLGLSVVRRLAQLLGGTVEVESELRVGSRFTVRIPRELPGAHPTALSAAPSPRPPRDPAAPP